MWRTLRLSAMTLRLSGDAGGDATKQRERGITGGNERELAPEVRERREIQELNHLPSLLPAEWRERAKNIIRRAHDPLSCLERCKSNSARLLGLGVISDKTPITKGGNEIREKPGSGPDAGTLCAGAAETEPSLACDALTNFEDCRRVFKAPPAIPPPVFIPVMEVVVSRWRNLWEAGDRAGIACRLQWQVNAGLIRERDHRALFVGFDPGKISKFNRLIQDPGGLLRQRRGSTNPRKRCRNSHTQGLLQRCATLTICLYFGLMASCNSESLGLISKKRMAFLDDTAGQNSMDKDKTAVRSNVSDKEEDRSSLDDDRVLAVHGSAIVGTSQRRGQLKRGTHNPNDVVLRETGTPMEGATIKPVDQHMLDMEKNAEKSLAFDQGSKTVIEPLALTNFMHFDRDPAISPKGNVDQPVKDKKRHKGGDGTSLSGQSSGSAASFEGDRRDQ